MSYLFKNVANNVDKFALDLKNWDTGKVTNMYYMFYAFCGGSSECKLENISNWNTSNVTNMSFTFNSIAFNAESFKLDISNWNINPNCSIEYMFDNCNIIDEYKPKCIKK
jgi:surface protein